MYFTHDSAVSIVDLEQVNANWDIILEINMWRMILEKGLCEKGSFFEGKEKFVSAYLTLVLYFI